MIPNFLRFSDGHTFICLFDVDGQLVVEKGKGRPKKDNNNENNEQTSIFDVQMEEMERLTVSDEVSEEMKGLREEKEKSKRTKKAVIDNLKVNSEGNIKILLACAWGSDNELRLWHLFPEALSMDSTMKTNNEKRSLFSVSIFDNFQHGHQVMKMFLPSEQTWVFHYIFSHVLPSLVGSVTISKCQIVLTDGDSCEYSPIRNLCENDRDSPWYGCYASLCTFHRFNIDWHKKVDKHLDGKKCKVIRQVIVK